MVILGWFTVPGAIKVAAKLAYCSRKVMCHAGILILEATMETDFVIIVSADIVIYIFLVNV